jgi:prophage regulatory protein
MMAACHNQALPVFGPTTRLLSLSEVRSITGLAVSTIYKGANEGWFPRARKIGPRSVRWVDAEITAWIRDLPEVQHTARCA